MPPRQIHPALFTRKHNEIKIEMAGLLALGLLQHLPVGRLTDSGEN